MGLQLRLPAEGRFGLSAQFVRAAVSVLANIAEGSKREHQADYALFLNMAEASLAEVECFRRSSVTISKLIRAAELDRYASMLTEWHECFLACGARSRSGTQSHS